MRRQGAILTGLALIAATTIGFLLTPVITQDPAYHNFADQRTIFGVPNLWNVISNAPFALVGLFGLLRVRSATARVFCIAVLATTFGSSWYHLHPDNQTLFWDRLPMSVGFMALFALVIGDRLDGRLGPILSVPLILLGAASVIYWRVDGDLRPYALVQFFPLLAIPAMLLLFPSERAAGRPLAMAISWYAIAKLLEFLDAPIYALGHAMSGHSLKHLAAAVASLYVVRWAVSVTAPSPARLASSAAYLPATPSATGE